MAPSSLSRLFSITRLGLPLLFTYLFHRHSAPEQHRRLARRLRRTLERLGSVFIKFGQMLALRPDLLPNIYCRELYRLLDRVPPFSPQTASAILGHELNTNPSTIFDHFDPAPIASASFAQVHRARLRHNHQKVAVKIQRPGLTTLVTSDLALLSHLAHFIDRLFHPATKFTDLVSEFATWTHAELDFLLEAQNLDRFNTIATHLNDGFRAPRVYPHLSTSQVLTMEYIPGYTLAQIIRAQTRHSSIILDHLRSQGFSGPAVVRRFIRTALTTAHLYGFFHADPHPANLVFTPTGELVFLDFGIVGTLTDRDSILILRYLRSLLTGDADGSLDALLNLCTIDPRTDLTAVKSAYRQITHDLQTTFSAATYLEQQELSGPLLLQVVRLLQTHGFHLPLGIVRYFKAFETIEGLIFSLYPELQVTDLASEFRRVSLTNLFASLSHTPTTAQLDRLINRLVNSLEDELFLRS